MITRDFSMISIDVTGVSLSLSTTHKVTDAQYRKRFRTSYNTVKLQIFVRYLFSYFRLETGSYVLIFILLRVFEENDVEIQWLQSKKKIFIRTFFKSTKCTKINTVRKFVTLR